MVLKFFKLMTFISLILLFILFQNFTLQNKNVTPIVTCVTQDDIGADPSGETNVSSILQNAFNSYDCVKLNGIFKIGSSINITNPNLLVTGNGTLKFSANNKFLRIKANSIRFYGITFDFNEKQFKDYNTQTEKTVSFSPITIFENLKNISFINTTFKNLKGALNGASTLFQSYALQISVNNSEVLVSNSTFKNISQAKIPDRFSGFC